MPFTQALGENKFETIFNISKDGIAILDLESNFLEFNPAYLTMSGFTREELLQQSCIGLTVQKDVARSIAVIQQVIETGYFENFEKTCQLKNGNTIQVCMSLTLLPDQNHILISTKDISKKQQVIDELDRLSKTDHLTQLPNRQHIVSLFNHYLQSLHPSETLYVCFLDLDKFKPINDCHGHAIGDELLKMASVRLQNELKTEEVVARIGGDEFVIIMRAKDQASLLARLSTLLENINKPYILPSIALPLEISCSIGVSQTSQHNNDFSRLLRQADQAMYQAKKLGQAKIQFNSFNK